MKKARNQIQIGREPLSHYVIRSEIYLSWLFAFFAICSTGLLIYSIVICYRGSFVGDPVSAACFYSDGDCSF